MNAPGHLILPVNRNDGELHDESRPLPFARAVGLDRAAVQLDQVAHYRQPQTEPAVLARRLLVGLPEPLEDVRQELRLDPGPRVADRDLDVRVDALQPDLHPPAFGGT